MEKNNNKFDGLIAMIKKATKEVDDKVIAVIEFSNRFFYGEMKEGSIKEPFELSGIDRNNICQDLYDCLINEFGERLVPGHSHGYDGSYGYFMDLGDNVMICFPEGLEYEDWIYNQVQKDNAKQREEKGKSK